MTEGAMPRVFCVIDLVRLGPFTLFPRCPRHVCFRPITTGQRTLPEVRVRSSKSLSRCLRHVPPFILHSDRGAKLGEVRLEQAPSEGA